MTLAKCDIVRALPNDGRENDATERAVALSNYTIKMKSSYVK